jgi:hypothetical protein
LFVVVFLAAVMAPAQTTSVINPRTVQFDPSPDNNTLDSSGQPVVIRYDLYFYVVGGTVPFTTVSLGKPAVGSDGTIQVDFSALMSNWPLPDGTYDARVVAVGQSGVGQSDVSNQFAFQSSPSSGVPTCTYALSATSWAATAAGGTGTVNVSASASTCGWTAMGTSSWIDVSPSSGTGSGPVTITVAPNTGAARSGVLTIAGQTYTVTQAALSCTYALAAASAAIGAAGGTGSVAVTASSSACGWTASSNSSWVTVSPSSGSGSGTATFTVAANTGAARTAVLTIAGQSYTVTQAALSCAYGISASVWSPTSAGGSTSVGVSASAASCGWTALSTTSWVTLTPASGTGSGSVTIVAAANTGGARSAVVTIAGQAYTVSQAGVACSYALSASALSVAAAGGSDSVTMMTNLSTCGWTAASNAAWVTASPASGTGSGTLTITVAANTGAARTATVTIGGQAYTVSQAAAACSYALSASALSAAAAGSTASVAVTTNLSSCGWTAASQTSWATVSPTSAMGSGLVTVTLAPNTGAARTANLTIAGQAYSVTQAAAPCSFGLSSASYSAVAGGGTSSVSVTSNLTTCGWTAAGNAAWVTASPASGTGSGTVAITVAPNTGAARTAAVTIAGQTYTVSQAAGSCTFSLSSTSLSVPAKSVNSSLTLAASSSVCTWSASSSTDWIAVSPIQGTGSGKVSYSIAKNTTGVARQGTFTAGGVVVTVTQATRSAPSKPSGIQIVR